MRILCLRSSCYFFFFTYLFLVIYLFIFWLSSGHYLSITNCFFFFSFSALDDGGGWNNNGQASSYDSRVSKVYIYPGFLLLFYSLHVLSILDKYLYTKWEEASLCMTVIFIVLSALTINRKRLNLFILMKKKISLLILITVWVLVAVI